MAKCKKCKTTYFDFFGGAERFCVNCGVKLPKRPKPERCSSCKSMIHKDDNFCGSCGEKTSKK